MAAFIASTAFAMSMMSTPFTGVKSRFVKVLFLRIGFDKYGILCKNVDMETTKSARTGHWTLTKGGITNYCSKGQHFTTDPVWNYWVGITSKMCVCDDCAQKEAS